MTSRAVRYSKLLGARLEARSNASKASSFLPLFWSLRPRAKTSRACFRSLAETSHLPAAPAQAGPAGKSAARAATLKPRQIAMKIRTCVERFYPYTAHFRAVVVPSYSLGTCWSGRICSQKLQKLGATGHAAG